MLTLNDFDYSLPEELIATTPPLKRGESRLLVVDNPHNMRDLQFGQIVEYLNPNDLIIFNNSKVLKARLYAHKASGGEIEILIERILPDNTLLAQIKSNKTIKFGLEIILPNNITLTVIEVLDGLFKLAHNHRQHPVIDWLAYLEQFGHVPLPPYMKREATDDDISRYQTVYAKNLGSIAAPTAGLHFSEELLASIKARGCELAYVTLHVGFGTFKAVTVENIAEHKMHSEIYQIPTATVDAIKRCRERGGKIIAVGTTTIRTLETGALDDFKTLSGDTNIFITPGFKFKVVDKLVTNFHIPKSTLLMLVSAFSGMDTIKAAYQHAIKHQYRFYSYGDASLLTRV